jgi:hypothetical protein
MKRRLTQMTRMQHEHIKDRWLARLASEVTGDTTGEGTRTRRRGFVTHPGLATGRAQLAELLDAAGIRASRGGRWHPDRLRRVWARWLRGELRLLLPSQSRHFCRRSAETHVQSVPGAVVSPSGRTGRLGRSAPPQLKPHLAWQSLHEAPYRKLRRRDRELKEGITDEQT